MAGLREHGGDPSGRTLGDLSPAVWEGALDRQTWDQVRAVLLNPERNTNVTKATQYLLTGLIYCGTCGAAMFSRPRNDHTKRYLCAGRRRGHQLGILAEPVDEMAKERVLGLLTTPSVREMLAQGGPDDDRAMGCTLAALGASQRRLQGLDDDFYVCGMLTDGRYRLIRVKLEREIDRLHALADAATKQRIVLHPDPRGLWAEADMQQRRDLVRLMVGRITVMSGRPAARHFDPSRVRIEITPWGRETGSVGPDARERHQRGLANDLACY